MSLDGVTKVPPAPIDIETPTRRGDVIAATLCLGTGLVGYFFVVPGAVYVPSRVAGTVNSPAFLPNVLFILLAGLGAIYLIQSLSVYLRHPPQGRVRALDWGLAGGTAVICIGYIGAIYIFGMSLATALCVAATMYYFGERRPWIIGPIAIILPVLLWYFFVDFAHILFPTPVLEIMGSLDATFHAAQWFA